MKINPMVDLLLQLSRPPSSPGPSGSGDARSFAELFLKATMGDQLGPAGASASSVRRAERDETLPLAGAYRLSSKPRPSSTTAQPGFQAAASALEAGDALAGESDGSGPVSSEAGSAVPDRAAARAVDSPDDGPGSEAEPFPSSGAQTVPPGYAPAFIPDLSVDADTGEIVVHLTPTTTLGLVEGSFMNGPGLPSLLGQLRIMARHLGLSLDGAQVRIDAPDLPAPFAGKSLAELNDIVLPSDFYASDPNGPYGSFGGQLPVTSDQRALAFALISQYVVDIGSRTA